MKGSRRSCRSIYSRECSILENLSVLLPADGFLPRRHAPRQALEAAPLLLLSSPETHVDPRLCLLSCHSDRRPCEWGGARVKTTHPELFSSAHPSQFCPSVFRHEGAAELFSWKACWLIQGAVQVCLLK